MRPSGAKPNFLPPGLVSNLQDVLSSRKGAVTQNEEPNSVSDDEGEVDDTKPIVLVTNAEGIESPGFTYLVDALVRQGLYNVNVCAPQSWVFFLSLLFLRIFLLSLINCLMPNLSNCTGGKYFL